MSTQKTYTPTRPDPTPAVEPFFGRHQVTRLVLEDLNRGQNISVVGPDRIGKTSFLHHIADPKVRAEHKIAEDYVFVYLDCSSLAQGDQETWYQAIEEATIRQLGDRVPEEVNKKLLKRFRKLVEGSDSPPISWRLGRLFRAVQMQGIKLVLALDDFEQLTQSPHLNSDFLQVMRALHADHGVIYLVTSLLPVYVLTPDFSIGSPYYNMFYQRGSSASDLFGPLEPQESRELVLSLFHQAGIEEPDDSVVDCILDLGENRPYSLKQAGHTAIRLWPSEGKPKPRQLCRQIRGQFG
jgi:hypothetical protein